MSENPRARKIADRIKVIVAETLEHKVKDPRLGFVTVTDTRVTGDLQHATVFYTVFGSDEERAGTAAALESAKGIIRREVGQGISLRLTPSLEFIADAMPENAAHIDDLLRRAAELDAAVAAQANGKAPAGEADPYRKPVSAEDSDEAMDDEDADARS
ncbi:MAG: 30S ribosome-binding factor RbfA [Angustibacter sp.]